jgi:hypothetical protein
MGRFPEMSCVLLWSAISRVAKQHISAWRAVVAVMLLGLTVVAGCDVRPFCDLEGSCSSDEMDDGEGGDPMIPLASTPEEIDAEINDVLTVQVRVVTPVSDRTYSFRISEQPTVGGQIDTESIEENETAGTMSFRFEATTVTGSTIDEIRIEVTDSASEEGSLVIPVSVGPDQDRPTGALQ